MYSQSVIGRGRITHVYMSANFYMYILLLLLPLSLYIASLCCCG